MRPFVAGEIGYVIGSTAHVALLAGFCFVTLVFSTDAFARLSSVAVTMAYLVGTPGRSFASPLLVKVLIATSAVPLIVGMALAGPWYWTIAPLTLVPFFLGMKTISARLHAIFVSAIVKTADLGKLATRFDTALNNMPQGLAMFDADGIVSVVNGRMLDILGIQATAWPEGSSLDDLLRAWRRVGPSDHLEELLSGDAAPTEEFIAEMSDGRSLAIRLQPMQGGGVLLVNDVTERVRIQAEINHLARFDPLTGIHNRRAFREAVAQRISGSLGHEVALLFVDLDRFKAINDTLGHVVGDQIVAAVAERLAHATGPTATLGRFGGDEFVVFDTYEGGRAAIEAVAKTIISELAQSFIIEGQRISSGASVGIATSPPANLDIDTLLRDADLALYRAKAEGRGTYRVFENDMKVLIQARRRTEEDMRGAVARGEFEVHYQPIFSLSENRYVVCEALVRWRHPERGMVPPSEFISIAEETGMIEEIGEWVLGQACVDCGTWPRNVGVAVNFSAVQFRRGDVASVIRRALVSSALTPSRLEIEITESLMLEDVQATASTLRLIKGTGVKLSLDDFGTGFSSLSYLQSLPFNKVKIDRSFLKGLSRDSRAMVLLRGIQRLSTDLGLSVVMEGVETPEQMHLVTETAGVDLIQGFLLSRPVPASEVRALLAVAPRVRSAA